MSNFISIINETIQRGIFFRSPIQKVYMDLFDGDFYKWDSKKWIFFWRVLLNLKLFYRIHKENKEENDEYDMGDIAGYNVFVFASPIFFKRNIRHAYFKFCDHKTIDHIVSYGPEPYMNYCAGAAQWEKTTFYFNDGTKTTVKLNDFHYTYKHIVEKEFI